MKNLNFKGLGIFFVVIVIINILVIYVIPIDTFLIGNEADQSLLSEGEKYLPYCSGEKLSKIITNINDTFCHAEHPGFLVKVSIVFYSIMLLLIVAGVMYFRDKIKRK